MLEQIVASAAQTNAGSEASTQSEAPQAELSGRPAFEARLAEEIARAARYGGQLSLLVLDLDGFAAPNQKIRSKASNPALLSAAIIESKIRTVDVMAHLGANQYAVILPETGDTGARIAAERMRNGLAEAGGGNQKPLSACFGVVQLSPDVQDGSELICRAQLALAAAQRCGANSVMHYQDLRSSSHAKPASDRA